jgi:hypothetical protein
MARTCRLDFSEDLACAAMLCTTHDNLAWRGARAVMDLDGHADVDVVEAHETLAVPHQIQLRVLRHGDSDRTDDERKQRHARTVLTCRRDGRQRVRHVEIDQPDHRVAAADRRECIHGELTVERRTEHGVGADDVLAIWFTGSHATTADAAIMP